jgi:hypothetical protein
MNRKPDVSSPRGEPDPRPLTVRIIPDDAIHPLTEWSVLLGVKRFCLRREARLGRLRTSKRGGRLWSTGKWVRQWLEDGEVKRPAKGAPENPN